MIQQTLKRFISSVLLFAMLVSCVTIQAYAEEGEGETTTLSEGTYTVTANLYVPAKENVILGVNAYLTNASVPPVAPVEKNAKLVVDAEGNMTLTLKNLNAVFTLQNIEDGEGVHITNREMQYGDFAGCTSRIAGLELQLTEKRDTYVFTNCKEQPMINGLPMQSMGLELKVDFDSAEVGYVDKDSAYTAVFTDVYKGFEGALTTMGISVVTTDSDAYEKLKDGSVQVTDIENDATVQEFLNEYYVAPTYKYVNIAFYDKDNQEIVLNSANTQIAMTYGTRTFGDMWEYPTFLSYSDSGWGYLTRIASETSNTRVANYISTTDHAGKFLIIDNSLNPQKYVDYYSTENGVTWHEKTVVMGYGDEVFGNSITQHVDEIEGLGTAYRANLLLAKSDAANEKTTLDLTLPHKNNTNYYLVVWDGNSLNAVKLNPTQKGDNDYIQVFEETADATKQNYKEATIYSYLKYSKLNGSMEETPVDISGFTTKSDMDYPYAFVLATDRNNIVAQPTDMGGYGSISGPKVSFRKTQLTYNGKEQTNPYVYDADKLTIAEDATVTATVAVKNALPKNQYHLKVTPKEGYTWADGTTTQADVLWGISKVTLQLNYDKTVTYGTNLNNEYATLVGVQPSDAEKITVSDENRKLDTSVLPKDETGNVVPGTYTNTGYAGLIQKVNPTIDESVKGNYTTGTSKATLTVLPVGVASDTKLVVKPTPSENVLSYTGFEQSYFNVYYDDTDLGYTITGENWGKDPGKYTCIVTLKDKYYWSDGTNDPITFDWYIKKAVTAPTAVTGLTANGKEQVGVPEGEGYTVTNGKATKAGNYTATVELKPGYTWSDGSEDPLTIEWSIESVGGNGGQEQDKDVTETVTANLFVPGKLNTQLPGVTAYLTNGNNPSGIGGYEKKAPTEPVYDNATLTTHSDGTRTLVLDIPNPVFTLQKLDGAPDGVTVTRVAKTSSDAASGERISQITVELPKKGDTFVFSDCEEYPTLLQTTWNVPLTLKLGKDGLDSKTDVDTGNIGNGGSQTTTTTDGATVTVKKDASGKITGQITLDKSSKDGADVTIEADLGKYEGTVSVKLTNQSGKSETKTGQYKDGKITLHVDESVDFAVLDDFTPKGGWASLFTDVKSDAYYYDAVEWAAAKGVTKGTSDTTFSPDQTCTRGQTVTFLWRAAGSPAPTSQENPFTDVTSSDYFYDAVLWAVEQGITKGTSATTFSPSQTVTRAQVVTFQYRLAGSPAAQGASPFTDVAADSYAKDAIQWAVEKGITKGTSETTFSPDAGCTRGQIVTFLYRQLGSQ